MQNVTHQDHSGILQLSRSPSTATAMANTPMKRSLPPLSCDLNSPQLWITAILSHQGIFPRVDFNISLKLSLVSML